MTLVSHTPNTVIIRNIPYDVTLDVSRELPNGVDNYYTLTSPNGREIKANVRMTPNSMSITSSSVSDNFDPGMLNYFKRRWHKMNSLFESIFNFMPFQYDDI